MKTIADSFGVSYRQQGSSHVVYFPKGAGLPAVPAARPIKQVDIRQFLALIDRLEGMP